MSKDESAAGAVRAPAAEAPHGSTSRMALLSALCPLAYLLWTAGRLDASSDGAGPAARRLDALIKCTAGELANSTAAGDGQYGDTARAYTWAAVRSTLLISLAVGAFCLALFEAYRRDPIVRKYVYDRKRLWRKGRVPPPLMLSRSLWTGEGDDGGGGGLRRFIPRVRPALLEIIFMTLDANYLRYARAADDARRMRESSGRYACCASGRYHNNCRNRIDRTSSDSGPEGDPEGMYVDEDGYVLRPGHPLSRLGERRPDLSRATSEEGGGGRAHGAGMMTSLTRNGSVRVLGGLFDEEAATAPLATRWRRSVQDLFPEDNDEARNEGGDGERGGLGPTASRSGAANCSTAELGEVVSIAEPVSSPGVGASEGPDVKPKDTSEAGNEGGTRKPSASTTAGTDVIWKDGCKEGDEEARKRDEIATEAEADADGDGILKAGAPSPSVEALADGDDDEMAADDSEELKYPSRFVNLCLPPGFHSWGSAVAYLESFLFLDAVSRAVKKKFGSGPLRPEGGESGDEDEADSFMRRLTRSGQSLSDGDAELLVGSRSLSACASAFCQLCFTSRATPPLSCAPGSTPSS